MDYAQGNCCIGALLTVCVILLVALVTAGGLSRSTFTIARTQDVFSAVDGQRYRVHLVHGDAKAAADTMAALNGRVTDLLRHLRNRYLRSPDAVKYPARRAAVGRLLTRYNPDHLAENSPKDPEGDTAYTIDKGAVLAICLRDKAPSRPGDLASHGIHDIDILTFVTFHELTHIAIEELDHPQRFWQAFKFILHDAAGAGIMRSVDYQEHPVQYCGMEVDYNPLYDSALIAIQ